MPTDYHAASPAEAVALLSSHSDAGLSDAEAAARQAEHGPNRLTRQKRPDYLALAVRQIANPLVLLLFGAAGVSIWLGEQLEAAVIGTILVLNAALGFREEALAEREIIALGEGVELRANVIRAGRRLTVPASEITIGDLVVLEEGDRVVADSRLVAVTGMEIDESLLTGESLPVAKTVGQVPGATPLADRTSMTYAATAVTRGRGAALVTAIGSATEVGQIAHLVGTAKPPATPMQRRLGDLTARMVVLGLAVTGLLAGAMILRGSPVSEAFLLGVAVAVAAVPEGLPAAVTLALALGARKMAGRGALVRRLEAVETLGETSVICADKTGTLTENRLRVATVVAAPGHTEAETLHAAALASAADHSASEDGPLVTGDPIERALLAAATERLGISPGELRDGQQLIRELPFDADRRRMTRVYRHATDGDVAYVKGAPEVLFARAAIAARADADREIGTLEREVATHAGRGLRVLAVGRRELDDTATDDEDVEAGLTLLGVVALEDPLRPAAREAVRAARRAGIGVRMLTGDHRSTALAIAEELGIEESDVFSRVTPAGKLEMVDSLQEAGEVIAVTGDGVNDSPALRRADVGVAMGQAGTEAAREAADIVLTDDNFATLVAAIAEGRRIADNVRTFVIFLLSANLGEVALFAVAVAAGLDIPLTVVQILTINVLTDGLPAIALSREPARPDTMSGAPRRGTRLLTAADWRGLVGVGALVGAAALAAFLIGNELDGERAGQSMAFGTLALAELALTFGIRSWHVPAWRMPPGRALIGAVLASLALVVAIYAIPPLRDPFGVVIPSPLEVLVILGLAAVPLLGLELAKAYRRANRLRTRPST